jgi:hypothetical protein
MSNDDAAYGYYLLRMRNEGAFLTEQQAQDLAAYLEARKSQEVVIL